MVDLPSSSRCRLIKLARIIAQRLTLRWRWDSAQQGHAIAAVITAATACTGVGAVVGAGVAAGFSAAAFAMQQAAQGQAALANDPPPPDFLTREPMTIVAAAYSSFGESLARHVHSGEFTRRSGDFMRFVEAAVFVHNAAKALPKIQAKLVGAVSAHDETGEKFQINQCREFVDALDKGIANLESAVPAAVAESKRLTEPHLTAIKHAHHNLLRSGLSQDERNELLSCGLPPNLIRIFERLRSQNKLQPPTIKINGHEVFNCRIIELGGAALISYGKAIRLSAVSNPSQEWLIRPSRGRKLANGRKKRRVRYWCRDGRFVADNS